MSAIEAFRDWVKALALGSWRQTLKAYTWTASTFSSPRRAREILSSILPSRTLLLAFWGCVSVVSVVLILLVFNPSLSLPQGFYVRTPTGEIQRGDLVSFCLAPDAARLARTREYLPSSSDGSHPQCPENTPPMIKRIQALPGDTVEVNLEGVYVNGKQVADPPPHCDASVRPLPIQYGSHLLQAGEYWVTTDLYLSLDSRVYGPVHRSQIFARAYPLLTASGQHKYLKSNPTVLRRTDCSTRVDPKEPLLEQVDLISKTASLDSLKAADFNRQFDSVSEFRPPLSFEDLFNPPEYPFQVREVDESTRLAHRAPDS